MKKKSKGKKLLAKAMQRVKIEGHNNLDFNREFLIRRSSGSYATMNLDNIRYTLYELATNENLEQKYSLIAKCLLNKTINYEMASFTEQQIKNFMEKQPEVKEFTGNQEYLTELLSLLLKACTKTPTHADFITFVKEYYKIEIGK